MLPDSASMLIKDLALLAFFAPLCEEIVQRYRCSIFPTFD